jgi:hypothetical protein
MISRRGKGWTNLIRESRDDCRTDGVLVKECTKVWRNAEDGGKNRKSKCLFIYTQFEQYGSFFLYYVYYVENWKCGPRGYRLPLIIAVTDTTHTHQEADFYLRLCSDDDQQEKKEFKKRALVKVDSRTHCVSFRICQKYHLLLCGCPY